jgi:glyoxylase-like metal-dependent hydrolase (beta-lactamase superfamily II)
MGWDEIATGVFQRRYDPLDVSICVIRGSDGLAVVDTRSSPRQANEIRADLRELGNSPVRCVVNTHAHFDHIFGNQSFGANSDINAPIYGHVRVPAHLEAYERPLLANLIARGEGPVEEWRAVVITPPTVLVGERHALDLGDRTVDLLHLGRGHTDNDLMLHIPDAAAWLLGDLIEESGAPYYGPESFPLEWPVTVAHLLVLLDAGDVLIPGHGSPVDQAFVEAQHGQLAEVANLIRDLHDAGVPVSRAADEGGEDWPFPVDGLADAIEAGYAQLSQAAAS